MLNSTSEDAARYRYALSQYCDARVGEMWNRDGLQLGFEAWLTCGAESFLGRPMAIPGELELSFEFGPYLDAGLNYYAIWTTGVAKFDISDREKALDTLNRAFYEYGLRFVKPYIDEEGRLYLGTQGLIDDGTSPLGPIRSFVEELDRFWPIVTVIGS